MESGERLNWSQQEGNLLILFFLFPLLNDKVLTLSLMYLRPVTSESKVNKEEDNNNN